MKWNRVLIHLDPNVPEEYDHHDRKPITIAVGGNPEPLAAALRDGAFTVTTEYPPE